MPVRDQRRESRGGDGGDRCPWRGAGRFAGLVTAVAFVVYAALILAGLTTPRASHDEAVYHLATVADLAHDLDADRLPDLIDLDTATTPGYHLVLAVVDAVARPGVVGLRLVSAVVAALMLGVAGWVVASAARGSLPPWAMFALLAPLALSLNVLVAAVHVLPDNAGWLCVFVLLGVLLYTPRRPARLAFAAWVLLGVVLARQVHAWAGGMILAAAWLDAGSRADGWAWLTEGVRDRCRAVFVDGIGVVPALVVSLAFIVAWGGLVPPAFQAGVTDPLTGAATPVNQGWSLAFPGVTLMSLGVVVPFFAVAAAPAITARFRGVGVARVGAVAAAVAVGTAALAAVPHSGVGFEFGRFGGWWRLAGVVEVADRSLVMIAFAGLAGGVGYALSRTLEKRTALLLLGALVGLTAAHVFTSRAFFRYVEPLVILASATAVAEAAATHVGRSSSAPLRSRGRPWSPWWFAAPIALALAFALAFAAETE